jgi:hypothetical protein
MGCRTVGQLTRCTSWDGHHALHIGSDPDRGFYSNLGPEWGTIGAWHPITEEQADRWWEDRPHVIRPEWSCAAHVE